ncbi:hypothetical protein GND95_03930 [Defluviitalea raffinosedens]|uniref:Potassium channel domain-containing protein n=2 Tax=Defluviitalea raffinosedens TaxID=1450156 RepID=A0A7C8LDU1_9FIRM|nr:hypothetical protein GND95_03930 [Defluviitalea raffinosedens]MBM7685423.1 hypothetical protein [Defluviitalea raffinosedens]
MKIILLKMYPLVTDMKSLLNYFSCLWKSWDAVSRLFFIFALLFLIGFFLIKYNIEPLYIQIIWFIGFGGVFLTISFISFCAGFLINVLLLLLLPFILTQTNLIFIDPSSTSTTLSIISYFFLIAIIDLLIMAYHISNRVFWRTLFLFIQYLVLLSSILITFAILYAYLGNISNEGIKSSDQIIQNWDALYFSATTFFTIGLGDITPHSYSTITKSIIIVQAVISHLVTTILWPIIIIFASKSFSQK